ncbi:MAG: type II toxin-antitoxin system PemK/MazF family toxin [Solirubrobacteraceae bacterium]
MRAIHVDLADGNRPVLVLTREAVRPFLTSVTVAPITTRIRGLPSEVAVGPANGLDNTSVVICDNLRTVNVEALGRWIGDLLPEQEPALAAAISAAFDLAE